MFRIEGKRALLAHTPNLLGRRLEPCSHPLDLLQKVPMLVVHRQDNRNIEIRSLRAHQLIVPVHAQFLEQLKMSFARHYGNMMWLAPRS